MYIFSRSRRFRTKFQIWAVLMSSVVVVLPWAWAWAICPLRLWPQLRWNSARYLPFPCPFYIDLCSISGCSCRSASRHHIHIIIININNTNTNTYEYDVQVQCSLALPCMCMLYTLAKWTAQAQAWLRFKTMATDEAAKWWRGESCTQDQDLSRCVPAPSLISFLATPT